MLQWILRNFFFNKCFKLELMRTCFSLVASEQFWSALIIANNIMLHQIVFESFERLCSNVILWSGQWCLEKAQLSGCIFLHCTWKLHVTYSSSPDEMAAEYHIGSNAFALTIRRLMIRVINAAVYEWQLRFFFFFGFELSSLTWINIQTRT